MGALSETCVVSDGVEPTREVEGLEVISSNRRIKGRWKLPEEAMEVIVIRKACVAPEHVDDGMEIVSGADEFVDIDVENGVRYYYRVRAVYERDAGVRVVSEGVVSRATPDIRPTEVKVLTCSKSGRDVEVSWLPPEVGQVCVYVRESPFSYRQGDVIPYDDVKMIGDALSVEEGNRALHREMFSGMYYYGAVSIRSDWACVGAMQRFVYIQSVANAVCRLDGNDVQVYWDWPEECQTVWVSWHTDGYPEKRMGAGIESRRISRSEYQHRGCFVLERPDVSMYYFAVFSSADIDGHIVYEETAPEDAKTCILKPLRIALVYALKPCRNWLGKVTHYDLQILTDQETVLPHIVFAVLKEYASLDPTEGQQIIELAGERVYANYVFSKPIPVQDLPEKGFLKGFVADAADCDAFYLEPVSLDAITIER